VSEDALSAQTALLDRMDMPCLLIRGEQVSFANEPALQLLGRYITGANVRLALRAPSAISAVMAQQDARALVSGLGTPESVWELNCQHLDENRKLVTMQDVSAQRSVARVHADFVANASHELRTPVANILGYVETLMDPRAGEDEATRTRFLGTIQREAGRMQALISDLMSLSRIEAGKHRLPDEKVDLVKICEAIAGEFQDFRALHVELPNGSAEIFGDSGQLKQMLRNLVDNAIKYGGDHEVTIALSVNDKGWANLSVTDRGEGIATQHIPRLTERFYRTDPGRSKAAGGTGLGLSIVKHIVSRHRGRMNIESIVGQGTSISVALPLAG
jgi:two-component system phosphate regulon sensor histidine kinase PhoR